MNRHYALYGNKIYIEDEKNNMLDEHNGELTATIVESIVRKRLQSTPPKNQPLVIAEIFIFLLEYSETIRKENENCVPLNLKENEGGEIHEK